jgi:hypothetical protein
MKKHYDADTHSNITVHDDGSMTRENLEIKPCVDSRNAIEKELDELFRQIGFAAVPLLTAAAMSVVFFLVIIITVIAKWIWTGSPF